MIALARTLRQLGRIIAPMLKLSSEQRLEYALLARSLAKGMGESMADERRYQLAEQLAGAVYPHYKFSEFGRSWLDDGAFIESYQRFMHRGNWHSLDRKYSLDQLLKLALLVPGDTAECGVFEGATSFLICQRLVAAQSTTLRMHHAFDSFEGLSRPTDRDGDYWQSGDMAAAESDFLTALQDLDNVRAYRGWIPERFAEVSGKRFAFVHVDVDLYQPTRDSIEFFFPRLSPGGVLLMDDYGFDSCPGARLAADEYFASRPEVIVELTTGQGFVIKRVED